MKTIIEQLKNKGLTPCEFEILKNEFKKRKNVNNKKMKPFIKKLAVSGLFSPTRIVLFEKSKQQIDFKLIDFKSIVEEFESIEIINLLVEYWSMQLKV